MNAIFTPISIVIGLAAGQLSKKIFDFLWGLVADEEAPRPKHREIPYLRLLVALLVEGAIGTIEATRFATGRRNALRWEINGSKGSLAFDLERLNELQAHLAGSRPGARAQGFRTVLVSETDHPFWGHWWPPGHIIGYEHTFVHELHHLLSAIRDDADVAPHGATFEDGYRAAEICDAMLRSAEQGNRETVNYRS